MIATTGPHRIFVVWPDGTTKAGEMTVSPKLDAAMDILADGGMLDAKRLRLLVACEQDVNGPWGGDCEALARKLVRLGRATKEASKRPTEPPHDGSSPHPEAAS